jgi:hypothetical protein
MSDDNDLNNGEPSADDLLDELGSLKELLDEERTETVRSVHEISSVEEYMRLKQEAEDAGMSIDAYLAQQALQEESEEEPVDIEVDESTIPLLDEAYAEKEPSAADEEAEAELSTPTTVDATTVDEYFAAVAASRQQKPQEAPPMPDEVVPAPTAEEVIQILDEVAEEVALPELEEVTAEEETIPELTEVVAEEETIPELEEVVEAGNVIPELDEVVENEEAIPLLDEAVEQTTPVLQEAMSMEEVQELVDLLVERKLQHLRPELEKEVMEELKKLLPISAFS